MGRNENFWPEKFGKKVRFCLLITLLFLMHPKLIGKGFSQKRVSINIKMRGHLALVADVWERAICAGTGMVGAILVVFRWICT